MLPYINCWVQAHCMLYSYTHRLLGLLASITGKATSMLSILLLRHGLCQELDALLGNHLVILQLLSIACHSQVVEEAAEEEVEEFEAIEKLETLGVNRGAKVCKHCSLSRRFHASMLALHMSMPVRAGLAAECCRQAHKRCQGFLSGPSVVRLSGCT